MTAPTTARFYLIAPEVAGELGEDTVMDASVHPPVVESLHYVFSDWLGSQLVESFPCYLVTRELGTQLVAAELTGFELAEADIELSEEADELFDVDEFPIFLWLKVHGTPGADDLGLLPDARLVVSEAARAVIEPTLEESTVEPYQP